MHYVRLLSMPVRMHKYYGFNNVKLKIAYTVKYVKKLEYNFSIYLSPSDSFNSGSSSIVFTKVLFFLHT